MDVTEQVARIRSVVESARSMPMSASAVINRSELLAQIDQLAADLPNALADADALTSERDRLASETEVYRAAEIAAARLLEDTRTEADELRRETDEYVDAKLATFEISLTKILEAVSRGRDRLLGRSELDALRDADIDDIALPGDKM